METNVNYTLVGAFVVTLFAAIIFSIIWLTSGLSLEKYTNYMIHMKESVTGLNPDSVVEFNGVNVGAVKKIMLDPASPELVDVIISIKQSTPVTQGTIATLNTRGITGLTFVALKDNGIDHTRLVAARGHQYPVIKTGPSIFLRFDSALRTLSENLQKVAGAIEHLLDPENQQAIKTTLKNLQSLSATMVENSQRFNLIMKNTAQASQQILPMIQSSSHVMHTLETQTLPVTYNMLTNLDSASRSLAETAALMKQNPAVLIRGTEAKSLGPGENK